MTSEQRADIANGIWLCQNHAKLIDDDEIAFPTSLLREWKDTAERMAYLEARGFAVNRAHPFKDLEKKAPELIAKMRENLQKEPLVREFVLLPNNRVSYGASYPQFIYFEDSIPYISSIMTIMIHVGAIYDARYNRVPRYKFTEAFVSFLIGEG
ncbi:hypothetical protein [Bradyrhizobium sp. RT6a]|uniref:hypothetical protein n=1 Tax=unclassified Bradyrhizobium TaxID=2631580 RepID=UPI0033941239